MSHHSSHDEGDEIRRAMSEKMKEVFGEYPAGKLNDQDEGALALAVTHRDGKVILRFPKPVVWIGFDAQQAIELAQSLLTHARAVNTGVLTVVLGPHP